jgi:NTP pyrophosphatase (non-canonical NTP hydrolase)
MTFRICKILVCSKEKEAKLSNVDLNKYKDFVKQVTSDESMSSMQMYNRMIDIETVESKTKVNAASLMTGAIGIASEGGEFAEIVKKCIFQGKPMDDETIFHCKRELGDIMWYWITSCRALSLDPNEVIEENVNKLKARYPGGEFDVHYSENRKDGDL